MWCVNSETECLFNTVQHVIWICYLHVMLLIKLICSNKWLSYVQQLPKTEDDIVAILPDKLTTMDTMAIMKLWTSRGPRSLGEWDLKFQYDPVALQAEKEYVFTFCLSDLSYIITLLMIHTMATFWLTITQLIDCLTYCLSICNKKLL